MIVRSLDDDLAEHRDEFLPTPAGQARLFATSAQLLRFACLFRVQQRLEQPRASSMQGIARRLFDRFEIELAALSPIAEDDLQEPPYFFGDFLLDRFGRFFSCALKVSSTGRAWQIWVLTSTYSRLNCCQRRNSSISS